jgi:hypothetical protein
VAILTLGLHPSSVDSRSFADLDEETLTARIAAGQAAMREAGFDVVSCLISADPDDAEKQVRECVAAQPIEAVVIGAGLRTGLEYTLLFERLVNLLIQLVPGIRFGFNTTPETTIEALRRLVSPGR